MGDLISKKYLQAVIETKFDMQELYLPCHFLEAMWEVPDADSTLEIFREHNGLLIKENKKLNVRNSELESELVQLKQILHVLQDEIKRIERKAHEQPK